MSFSCLILLQIVLQLQKTTSEGDFVLPEIYNRFPASKTAPTEHVKTGNIESLKSY